MTHKKRPSTEKMYDYKKEKVEFARELGVNGANNTEVNAKMLLKILLVIKMMRLFKFPAVMVK